MMGAIKAALIFVAILLFFYFCPAWAVVGAGIVFVYLGAAHATKE